MAVSNYVLVTIIIYLIVLLVISLYAQTKIKDVEDYAVAGRRLNLSLSTATLFATWFGAGTLMTMTDEVSVVGFRAGLLDPIGAGLCLIIVGFWFAVPLWRMKLMTLADFFKVRFGVKTEKLTACVMLPTYFGWIAVQFIALSELLRIFIGLPTEWGLLLVAFVGTFYTLIGGMWSVTLTDFIQSIALIIGVFVLGYQVFHTIGVGDPISGLNIAMSQTSAEKLLIFPADSMKEIFQSLNLLVIGSLGNVAGQDLAQRLFASKSENVARKACICAGIIYILVGLLPMFIGISAKYLISSEDSIILNLVANMSSKTLVCVYIVMILSVVLSTIDSAILSPATILSQNLLQKISKFSPLTTNKISVVIIATLSLITAYVGESAYGLLEQAYEMQLIGLFIPLCAGLFLRGVSEVAIIINIILSVGIWMLHKFVGWGFFFEPLIGHFHLPVSLSIVILSLGMCFSPFIGISFIRLFK